MSRFLSACRGEPADRTPVWFMRQAGRSLPEYRALRERHSFQTLARTPELCAEVTLLPVDLLGVDAAILFADIMTPLIAVDAGVELAEGVGPVVAEPVRSAREVARIRPLCPEEDLPEVLAAIRLIKGALAGRVPLIGFCGAPFTLAAYLVEGRGSKEFVRARAFMYSDPVAWHDLLSRLAAMQARYLNAQIDAGVDAVQLFDSWVGLLGPADYERYVRPHTRRLLAEVAARGVPVIHFGTGASTLLPQMRDDGGTVIGVDWRLPLDDAWRMIGDRPIQGNLDPAVLLGPWETVREQAEDLLRRAEGRPGHIFNLGHGIHPQTPKDHLRRLVELVHARTGRE